MEKIKLGIIGMGNMGSGHFRNVKDGKCPSVEVTAVCDINPERLENLGEVTTFTDADKMLESGKSLTEVEDRLQAIVDSWIDEIISRDTIINNDNVVKIEDYKLVRNLLTNQY